MDKIIKATDGKEYLVTAKEYDLSMTMAEMLRDYADGVQENALRLAQYRDHIRAEAWAEALKEAAEKLRSLLRGAENDSPDCDFIHDDAIKSAIAILTDEPKGERWAEAFQGCYHNLPGLLGTCASHLTEPIAGVTGLPRRAEVERRIEEARR